MLGANSLVANFHLQDGLLYRWGHLCVPSSKHVKMIVEAHYSQVARHFHNEKTLEVLQKHLYWLKLRQDVSKYIRSYTPHAISKPTTKKQGLYTPMPTPNISWESMSMDYMLGLLSTKRGNDCGFVVVDRFSKMVILVACKKNITAEATAKNEYGYILGSHKPLSQTVTFSSSAHSGRASGHRWIPSSPNPLPSTPR
jgi:hypothetical protein